MATENENGSQSFGCEPNGTEFTKVVEDGME
jgi:hypothetical protein